MNRQETISRIQARTEPWDVIVIGGGATGLGTAVDAASRGFSTLLVEQADFAKGTSSRSTKLVHGGVRYLKQGNVPLVLDALRERGLMLQNAPHLVHDLEFIIPSYNMWQAPFYGIGMKVYDGMARKLSFGKSRMISRKKTIEYIPTIETNHLRGGVIYHDGQFDDSRLAVNLAQTAVELGADVVNHTKCVGLLKESGRVVGIQARDGIDGHEMELRARAVVNATGVFVDDILKFDTNMSSDLVTVSQGIHFVLPRRFLPGKHALMVPKTEDGRVLFAIPWHGHVVIGTTDTPVHAKTLEPVALKEERDFVMEHACKYLAMDPTDDDVLSVFSGLRPLVSSGKNGSTAKISRDHTILVSESRMVTVTGGKWTTYRKMGQDVVNQVIKVSGLKDKPCVTSSLKIHGWAELEDDESVLNVYGSDAVGIEQLYGKDPSLRDKIHQELPYSKAEVKWHVRNEMAMTVEDVLSRRIRAILLNARASIEAAPVVADLIADELGRSEEWKQDQVREYTRIALKYVYTDKSSTGVN